MQQRRSSDKSKTEMKHEVLYEYKHFERFVLIKDFYLIIVTLMRIQ